MSKINSFWLWVARHKYAAAIIFFTLLIGVLDENSMYRRMQSQSELSALKSEIRSYRNRYDDDTRKLEQLGSSIEAVRRVARERYYMTRENEDLFVFVKDTASAYAATE